MMASIPDVLQYTVPVLLHTPTQIKQAWPGLGKLLFEDSAEYGFGMYLG